MPHIQAAPFSHMPLLVRGYAQLGDPEIRRITAFDIRPSRGIRSIGYHPMFIGGSGGPWRGRGGNASDTPVGQGTPLVIGTPPDIFNIGISGWSKEQKKKEENGKKRCGNMGWRNDDPEDITPKNGLPGESYRWPGCTWPCMEVLPDLDFFHNRHPAISCFFPVMFITIACRSRERLPWSQSPLMARWRKRGREGAARLGGR